MRDQERYPGPEKDTGLYYARHIVADEDKTIHTDQSVAQETQNPLPTKSY